VTVRGALKHKATKTLHDNLKQMSLQENWYLFPSILCLLFLINNMEKWLFKKEQLVGNMNKFTGIYAPVNF
jgi:hypothetical protein